jgi:hypothetical protein
VLTAATTFDVVGGSDADYLLGVLLEKETFKLLEIVRLPWPMVEWIGRPHGNRWRLLWSAGSAAEGIAERL